MCYLGKCGNICHTGPIVIEPSSLDTAGSIQQQQECRGCGQIGRFRVVPRCN